MFIFFFILWHPFSPSFISSPSLHHPSSAIVRILTSHCPNFPLPILECSYDGKQWAGSRHRLWSVVSKCAFFAISWGAVEREGGREWGKHLLHKEMWPESRHPKELFWVCCKTRQSLEACFRMQKVKVQSLPSLPVCLLWFAPGSILSVTSLHGLNEHQLVCKLSPQADS